VLHLPRVLGDAHCLIVLQLDRSMDHCLVLDSCTSLDHQRSAVRSRLDESDVAQVGQIHRLALPCFSVH
jgi:hypothetical protein